MTYTKSEIKSSIQRVTAFITRNKRNPNTIKVGKDTLTLTQYLKLPQIIDGKQRILQYITNHNGTWPNYVTITDFNVPKDIYTKLYSLTPTSVNTNKPVQAKTRFISEPYLLSSSWVKQDYDTSCALNSIQQSVYKLTGLKISESTMYKLGYTGSTGTSHEGIKKIIEWINRSYKQKLTIQFKNLSDFGSTSKERWTNIGTLMSRKDTAIFAHIGYTNGGTTCNNKDNWHGHYEVFDIVNVSTMYIRALNSLSGGYLQDRKISVEECFMKRISQPSIIIIQNKK